MASTTPKALVAPRSFTNADIWNAIRNKFPNFANHTSKGTKEMFTAEGYEQLKLTNPNALSDFFELSMKAVLQLVNFSYVKDILSAGDFGEYFATPFGGIIQRMSVDSILPITPSWVGLKDGDSPDQYVVRKPKTAERLFKQNFNYQSLVTMPDDFAFKQIFVNEYGMNELMAGIMQGLQNGYDIQLSVNKFEALNAGINSTDYPLQDTQTMTVEFPKDVSTATQKNAEDLWLGVKQVIDAMVMGPQSWAFNALSYASIQDKSRLRVLIRPGYKNQVNLRLMAAIFNPDRLGMSIDDFIEVPNFGGLTAKTDVEGAAIEPKYDELGSMVGYVYSSDKSPVYAGNVKWEDPNEDVIAIIADKGYIFHSEQNPYSVEAARNVRGRYTNFWAQSENNSVNVDHLYNVVVIRRKDVTPAT